MYWLDVVTALLALWMAITFGMHFYRNVVESKIDHLFNPPPRS